MLTSIQGKAEASFHIDAHEPPWSPSSSEHIEKHQYYDRWPHRNVHAEDFAPPRPVKGSTNTPRSTGPHTSYQFKNQDTIRVFRRDAKDLYEESSYDIAPDTATKYPCTQNELNASGGANRRTALKAYYFRNKTKWFAHPNKGPFLDARIATREVFDHNHPERAPSAAENEAISRLVTGFKNAGQEPWGPDLAIKAFCDLDQVFFCGRLKGHVCLTWKRDRSFKRNCFGCTYYLEDGKCVIQLNAHGIFFSPEVGPSFIQMFSTLLHEMW